MYQSWLSNAKSFVRHLQCPSYQIYCRMAHVCMVAGIPQWARMLSICLWCSVADCVWPQGKTSHEMKWPITFNRQAGLAWEAYEQYLQLLLMSVLLGCLRIYVLVCVCLYTQFYIQKLYCSLLKRQVFCTGDRFKKVKQKIILVSPKLVGSITTKG